MHTKFERLLSKSPTTLEVMTYYLVVHTGPGLPGTTQLCGLCWPEDTTAKPATRDGSFESLQDNAVPRGNRTKAVNFYPTP